MKLSEIAEKIGGVIEGDADIEITGPGSLAEAGTAEIAFLANPKYAAAVSSTKASAVIVKNDWEGEAHCTLVRVDDPDSAFAAVSDLLAPPPVEYGVGIHPSAIIADSAEIGANAYIGPYCVIEPGAVIGDNAVLVSTVYVGHNVTIGNDCRFYPFVSIREGVQIGNRVTIHNSTVIGSDGFGFARDRDGVYRKIRQAGIVELCDDVEIGANAAVDRARFGKTIIGKGVKLDNLVQIAHNVRIGENTVMAALSGVSGSTHIGRHVQVAGQVGFSGHIKVGDGAILGAQSGISKDVEPGKFMFGTPAQEYTRYAKQQSVISSIPRLKKRIAALEKELAEIKGQL